MKLFFEDLGWGVIETGDHDLGTDLYLQIRDAHLTEMLLMLGVQVKTGDSELGSSRLNRGKRGWWFSESDQRHANYWSNHPVPHIVVLQNKARSKQYWAEANRDTIINTGQGYKIFVPESQPLDASFVQPWTQIAERAQKRIALEGSHWSFDVRSIPKEDQARHALIVPRLVAPHPNRGTPEHLHWAEALAFAVDGHEDRWRMAVQGNASIPTPEEASIHREYGWRLAGDAARWMRGDSGVLDEPADLDRAPVGIRIAHAIVMACFRDERGEIAHSEPVLRALSREKEHSPNQGWLSIFQSAIASEQGDVEAARRHATRATVQLASVASDVTVSPLRAAAAWTLFTTEPVSKASLENAVTSMDHTADWWRTAKVASALRGNLERTYEALLDDGTIRFGGRDAAHNGLYAAAANARLSGLRASAFEIESTLGKLDLVEGRNPANILSRLYRSGDHKALKRAIEVQVDEGRMIVVRDFVDEIGILGIPASTVKATATAITGAGHFASQDRAAQLATDLAAYVADPTPRPASLLFPLGGWASAMAAVAWAATDVVADQFVDYFLESSAEEAASSYSRILGTLQSRGLLVKHATRLADMALEKHTPVWKRWMLARSTGHANDAVRNMVHTHLLGGEIPPIAGLQDLHALTVDEGRAVLETCASNFNRARSEDLLGMRSGTGADDGEIYAKVWFQFPDDLDFQPLVDFLGNTTIRAHRKAASANFLALTFDALSMTVQDRIRNCLVALRASPSDPFQPGRPRNSNAVFDHLTVVAKPKTTDAEQALIRVSQGTTIDDRLALAGSARAMRHTPTLLALSTDLGPASRIVSRGILEAAQRGDSLAIAALPPLASDVPVRVADGFLDGFDPKTDAIAVATLMQQLLQHPSAIIRQRAQEKQGQ